MFASCFLSSEELRALAKAAPYLENQEFFTGNEEEDRDVKKAVKDLLSVVKYVSFIINMCP